MLMQDAMYDYCDTDRWLVVGPRLVVKDAWPRQLARWQQFADIKHRLITAEDFGLEHKVAVTLHGRQVEIPYSRYMAMDPKTRPSARRCGLTFGEREDKAAVKRALRDLREELHMVSWEFLPWLVKAYGANWPYNGLALDEAIFCANSETDRHKAVWHVVHRLGRVNRLIELTGAPTPNNYESLHGQVRLIDGRQPDSARPRQSSTTAGSSPTRDAATSSTSGSWSTARASRWTGCFVTYASVCAPRTTSISLSST
jgi:hypothetical protein